MSWVGLFQPRILKDRRERRTTAVRERLRLALAIVRDESSDGHGLHRMVDDADRAVANAGRDAEQNHVILCAEFCRRLFHRHSRRQLWEEAGLSQPHRLFAGRLTANGSSLVRERDMKRR